MLYEAQSLPEIKWVEAQTRLRQAESLFEIAKKNLSDCALYAPFDGVVGERRASAGETVLPGVPVMNLLQIGTVKVRFSVPEQEIAAIGADSRMRITVPALGDRTFQAGKIEKGAVANPAAHTYDVRAALANAGGELLPGMVCRVEVSPAGAAEQIALPRRTAGGRRKLFRMDRARRLGRAYGRDDGPSGEQRCRAEGRRPERRPDRGGRYAEDRRRQ